MCTNINGMCTSTGLGCTSKHELLALLSPTVISLGALQGYSRLFRGRLMRVRESLNLKQNTVSTEDDTLMGTDVCSDVVYRLREFGYRCGRDLRTLTCVHDDANCGHQIHLTKPNMTKTMDHPKILPILRQSSRLHIPVAWWTSF